VPEDALIGYAGAALFVVRDVTSAGLRDTLLSWSSRPGAGGHRAGPRLRHGRARGQAEDKPRINRYGLRCRSTGPSARSCAAPGRSGSWWCRARPATARATPSWRRPSTRSIAAGRCWWPPSPSTRPTCWVSCWRAIPARYRCCSATRNGGPPSRPSWPRGAAAGVDRGQLSLDDNIVRAAELKVAGIVSAIEAALTLERRAAELVTWQPLLAGLQSDLPRTSELDFDEADAFRWYQRATTEGDGWWRDLYRRYAEWRLRTRLGAAATVPVDRPPGRTGGGAVGPRRGHAGRDRRHRPRRVVGRTGRRRRSAGGRGRHRDAAPGHQRAAVVGGGPAQRVRVGVGAAGRAQPAAGGAGGPRRRGAGAGAAAVGRHRDRRRGSAAADAGTVRPRHPGRGRPHRPDPGRAGAGPGQAGAGRRRCPPVALRVVRGRRRHRGDAGPARAGELRRPARRAPQQRVRRGDRGGRGDVPGGALPVAAAPDRVLREAVLRRPDRAGHPASPRRAGRPHRRPAGRRARWWPTASTGPRSTRCWPG
jgi:hypothetical protein